jgi:hypothetical protein
VCHRVRVRVMSWCTSASGLFFFLSSTATSFLKEPNSGTRISVRGSNGVRNHVAKLTARHHPTTTPHCQSVFRVPACGHVSARVDVCTRLCKLEVASHSPNPHSEAIM